MVTQEQFEVWVEEGIRELPDWVREKLVNVAFIVREEPTRRQREEEGLASHETLFGLYEGVPLIDRGNESPAMPDTITIFKGPILEMYEREDEARMCVYNTVWHEVAHYFGHDEDWVEREELRRHKLL